MKINGYLKKAAKALYDFVGEFLYTIFVLTICETFF
jgi:hypothetical protein